MKVQVGSLHLMLKINMALPPDCCVTLNDKLIIQWIVTAFVDSM